MKLNVEQARRELLAPVSGASKLVFGPGGRDGQPEGNRGL
jgi:hypothetical protein